MPEPGPRGPDDSVEHSSSSLTNEELTVLRVLEKDGPMNAIETAAATARAVEEVLPILRSLVNQGLLERIEPEPVEERFALDTEALDKVLV